MELIETRLLRTFVAIAETGNLKKASVRIGKSTSTLSRWLAEFEDQIGYTVFHRISNGLVLELNEAGIALLPKANTVLGALARFSSQVNAFSLDDTPSKLRLAFDQFVENDCIVEIVDFLKKQYPNTEVSLSAHSVKQSHKMLLEKTVDLVLHPVSSTAYPDIGGNLVGEEQVMFVVNPSHPLLKERNIGFQQLLAHTLILPSHMQDESFEKKLKPLDTITTPDFALSVACAKQGLGIAYVPAHAARSALLAKGICKLDINWEEFGINVPLILEFRVDFPFTHIKDSITQLLREWFSYSE